MLKILYSDIFIILATWILADIIMPIKIPIIFNDSCNILPT
ncbi:hypothetical protein RINTHH_730 [Richelia intracellularis HH01]|uniref:Uncharacterized protein n=1 Tax=Richelia intracellularis HH01 TaxID=1165094 RepID=M1WYV6_9NOST|nr:hypothetical protein RINTHH_730 [Richelia intracellularis HH01]